MKNAEEILRGQFYKDEFDELMQNLGTDITPSLVKAMKQYANMKLDEAADNAKEMVAYDQSPKIASKKGIQMRNYQVVYATPKQSILKLKDEL